MAPAPSPASAQPTELEPAPLRMPWDPRLTELRFQRVCQAHGRSDFLLPAGSVLSPDALCGSWRLRQGDPAIPPRTPQAKHLGQSAWDRLLISSGVGQEFTPARPRHARD